MHKSDDHAGVHGNWLLDFPLILVIGKYPALYCALLNSFICFLSPFFLLRTQALFCLILDSVYRKLLYLLIQFFLLLRWMRVYFCIFVYLYMYVKFNVNFHINLQSDHSKTILLTQKFISKCFTGYSVNRIEEFHSNSLLQNPIKNLIE